MTLLKSGLCLFLPFAAAYFVSYLFRVINAAIAGTLVAEFDLDAAQLGVLTSIYFLTFAAVQLPVGAAIDRFGPSRVQEVLGDLPMVGIQPFGDTRPAQGFEAPHVRLDVAFGVAAGNALGAPGDLRMLAGLVESVVAGGEGGDGLVHDRPEDSLPTVRMAPIRASSDTSAASSST